MVVHTTVLYLLVLYSVTALSQIDLDLTDWVSDIVFEHDCLHVAAKIEKESDPYQIISYRIGELSSQWNIDQNNRDQKLTFYELYQLNITSEQLYIWSPSIDVMERYQLYINKISTSNECFLM